MKLIFTILTLILGLTLSEEMHAQYKVSCVEKESKNPDGVDPITTKTCIYKKYKSVTKGYPDYKGRYSYNYFIYLKQENGSYLKIKNAALFNENKTELLYLINEKIKKEFNLLANDLESKDCFEGISLDPFSFDQIGIEFADNSINFCVTFGLPGVCMAVDGTSISFKLDEIQKFLK